MDATTDMAVIDVARTAKIGGTTLMGVPDLVNSIGNTGLIRVPRVMTLQLRDAHGKVCGYLKHDEPTHSRASASARRVFMARRGHNLEGGR